LITSILIVLINYGIASAQAVIKIDVDLVTVNTTVTDGENRPVTQLGPEHFQIWEDKVEQQIEYFSAEDVPISLGIIFDVSGSMAQKIATARDAAVTFLRNGNPEDEYFLIQFSDRATVSEEFSSDVASLQRHIVFTSARGKTAMYDAVYLGLDKLKSGNNSRKALLLITDGQDNHSHYTASNIKDVLKEKDVQVYAIGIEELGAFRAAQSGRATLQELADTSAGRAFFIDSVQDLEDVCLKVALLLKNQYVVGYKSSNAAKDGKWRKIRLKVNPPKGISHLSIRSKSGYYAPTSEAAFKSN
jgi:Ca-activated chloride channel family protein